jgi:pentalenene oxygenase
MADRVSAEESCPYAAPATKPATFGRAPGAVPVVGHAVELYRRPLEFLASLPAHGDVVELRLGPGRAYMVCTPDLTRQVLLDSRTFDKGGPVINAGRQLIGDGLATCDWLEHKRQRPLVQPAFRTDRITSYARVMEEEIQATTADWRDGDVHDVSAALRSLTIRVTARTLFSAPMGAAAVTEVEQGLPSVLSGLYWRMLVPLQALHRLPTPGNRRFQKSLARLHDAIGGIIAEYRNSAGGHNDILSAIFEYRGGEHGDSFSDSEIRNQIFTFLIGATETTASALSWVFYLLSANPEAEEQLHAEVDAVLGGRPAVHADLPRLDYCRRVLTEALRLYPPVWAVSRTTTAETELAGHPLARNATVMWSPYLLHRHPDLFSNPDEFDPDRWPVGHSPTDSRGAMFPFAAGRRKCIGDNFAVVEATLALATIASRWRLRRPEGMRLVPEPKMTLGTGPLPLVCTSRSPQLVSSN